MGSLRQWSLSGMYMAREELVFTVPRLQCTRLLD